MFFSGRVHTILYDDPARAFYILKMVLDSDPNAKDPTTVKGSVPGPTLRIGSWFGFEAEWTKHKEYGKQLTIKQAPILPSSGWDEDSASRALMGNGVGPQIVQILKLNHGADLPNALTDQAKLEATPGIDAFTALYVKQRWQRVQAYFRGLGFLLDLKLNPGLVRKVWSTFGDDVEVVLSTNPWALVKIDGISFEQADEIAVKMRLDPKSPNRLSAAILGVCKTHRSMGHLYMSTSQLFRDVRSLIPEMTTTELGTALAACHKDGSLVVDRNARPGTLAVYEPWHFMIEKDSSDMLLSRMQTASFSSTSLDVVDYVKRLTKVGPLTEAASKAGKPFIEVVTAAVEDWQSGENLALTDTQKQGVINALSAPISILTGLPGTGKSTSCRAVVKILQEAGVRFLLCAPTGIAAKNLGTLTGATASTIHRAFSAKGINDEKRESNYTGIIGESDQTVFSEKDEEWGYGINSPHAAEVVIIDESSMVDQHLIYRLLTCTSPSARLVFVGDAAQLPSVGPGNVLRDLIKSGRFPVTNLIEIFRQKDTSAIVFASHAIYRGEMPECEPPSDFSLLRADNEEAVLQVVLKLAEKMYEKRTNFQILSPRHAGTVGVTNLNSKLRDLLNPSKPGLREIRIGVDLVREDDRIMVVHNDYKLGVFNGDVGKVQCIDNKLKEIELKIFGEKILQVRVPFKNAANTIRLAYACTVHKVQGLEFDVIVMPLVDSFKHQLQRNLLYTAVTRAKKRVILVGSYPALSVSVGNDREDLRNTLLRDRLIVP